MKSALFECADLLSQIVPDHVIRFASALDEVMSRGGMVYALGCGGSAAQCDHLVAELTGRFEGKIMARPAVSLCCNGAAITAIVNDFDPSEMFAVQLESCLTQDDAVIALSTSGRSPSVIKAIALANNKHATTFALTGLLHQENSLGYAADHTLYVQSDETARIQEIHQIMIHLICQVIVERDR